jgi:hypothetical protein
MLKAINYFQTCQNLFKYWFTLSHFALRDPVEDPAPLGLAKINGKMSSMLPTELMGGLLKRARNLKILQSSSDFTTKGSKIQFLTYIPRFPTPHTYPKLILMKRHIFYPKTKFW